MYYINFDKKRPFHNYRVALVLDYRLFLHYWWKKDFINLNIRSVLFAACGHSLIVETFTYDKKNILLFLEYISLIFEIWHFLGEKRTNARTFFFLLGPMPSIYIEIFGILWFKYLLILVVQLLYYLLTATPLDA